MTMDRENWSMEEVMSLLWTKISQVTSQLSLKQWYILYCYVCLQVEVLAALLDS